MAIDQITQNTERHDLKGKFLELYGDVHTPQNLEQIKTSLDGVLGNIVEYKGQTFLQKKENNNFLFVDIDAL